MKSKDTDFRIPFGPVPSRRLGYSLGINNIPPKICSYSCIYCQIGKTLEYKSSRENFYLPKRIYSEVKKKVEKLRAQGERIDYLSFVPDGEPTLDVNLGEEIDLLRNLDIPIAVITNTSTIHDSEVRRELSKADWVSLKVDAVSEKIIRRLNRPCPPFDLSAIQSGMKKFSEMYSGALNTETMLIEDINTDVKELKRFQILLES